MTFFVKLNIAREADGSVSQMPDSGTQCQVVALSTLSQDLVAQMLLFRKCSGIAALFICGQHTGVKGAQQC